MFKKIIILMCLVSFFPAAAGAQDLTLIQQSPLAIQRTAEQQPAAQINLSPPVLRQASNMVAANDLQASPAEAAERPKKTHTGLTFEEFCQVHFGEYRWIYWVGAVAAIVALHVAVVGKD